MERAAVAGIRAVPEGDGGSPAARHDEGRRVGVERGPSDARLVRRAQRGSREAAAALFARHWPAAHRAALAVTGSAASAEDVAQDAFERAFAGIGGFDARRPFAPWLHRIVVNRALDLLRRERRLVGLDAVEEPGGPDPWDGAEDPIALRAVAALDPDRRAVVVLRYLLDYRPPEIAEMLGIPVGTVNSRLGRALAELRDRLEAGGE
jgi:RNA polymerase sigma-70 factor (ECF subfamily)